MRFRIAILLCCAAGLHAAQAVGCAAVDGDRILAKDLAGKISAFGKLPPETLLGPTPPPGAMRTFRGPELLSLARLYSVDLEKPEDVCFQLAMEPLDRERVLDAMRTSLQTPDARIEIAEMSAYAVPKGRVEFVRDRLGAPASTEQPAPVLWRGDVLYGANRRFAVWARVNIVVRSQKVFAVELLKPEQPIDSRQLRLETIEGFPAGSKSIASVASAAGMVPLHLIAAGSEVRSDSLADPKDVNRGDLIQVEVRSGGTRLAFIGRAESAGREGDSIPVRNPDSNKLFQALVTGKGTALVQAGWAKGN